MQCIGKHFPAAMSTLVLLMLLALNPLASSVLVVKDTEIELDPVGVPKFGTVGINDTFSVRSGFVGVLGQVAKAAVLDSAGLCICSRGKFILNSYSLESDETL
jgi:hypothetical protein